MKKYQTLLFYKYVHISDPVRFAEDHLAFCHFIGIKGRVLIAKEGVNGTVSGSKDQTEKYMHHLQRDQRFTDMVFKVDESRRHSFVKMHVRVKKEIVHFGVAHVNVWDHTGDYMEPEEWLQVKDDADTIVLDVRNRMEWEVGKFKEAVTLPIEHFRDLPRHLPQLERFREKKILAYCTGGIRCEKATAFLHENGFKEVYHLKGGIIEYAKKTGGKDFEGKCYVFDNRITIDVNSVNPTTISVCSRCGDASSRFINCANPDCNKHFILCESCGWETLGTCSDGCRNHHKVRTYDGSGFYQKGREVVRDYPDHAV